MHRRACLPAHRATLDGASLRTVATCPVGTFLDAVDKPIKQVTRNDVEQFLLAQTREGWAPRTRKIYLASIRWLLRASGRRDVTALLRQARVAKALGTVLSGSDVETLLAAITSFKCRAILMTAYGAGLRIGEVLALEVSDIDSSAC